MSAYLKRLQIDSVEEFEEEPSAYLKRVEIVEVVDQDGNPWEPVPGPDPWDELVVSKTTKISNGSTINPIEVYSFESVIPVPATFVGGFGTLTVQTRTQKYSGSTASWQNMNDWSNSPVAVPVNGTAPGTQLRAQTRATDTTGATKTSNSPTPTVGVVTQIGTVVITPDSAALAAGIEQEFTASVSGGSATNLMYNWTVRSGSAQLMSANNISSTALYKFDTAGSTQIQCYVASPGASNTPQSAIATIIVS